MEVHIIEELDVPECIGLLVSWIKGEDGESSIQEVLSFIEEYGTDIVSDLSRLESMMWLDISVDILYH